MNSQTLGGAASLAAQTLAQERAGTHLAKARKEAANTKAAAGIAEANARAQGAWMGLAGDVIGAAVPKLFPTGGSGGWGSANDWNKWAKTDGGFSVASPYSPIRLSSW